VRAAFGGLDTAWIPLPTPDLCRFSYERIPAEAAFVKTFFVTERPV